MMDPLARVKLVLLLVLLVVVGAVLTGVGFGLERVGWRRRGPVDRWLALLSLPPLALGVAAFLWALLIEADWLEVTTHEVPTAKWPAGERRRIALVSDLHVDRPTRALEELARRVRDANVDLVVFAGDALNAREATATFRASLGGLPARHGRVAVRGNHDTARWADVDLFGGGVATELAGDEPVLLDGGKLALCGAAWGQLGQLEACLGRLPADAVRVFVFHSPDLVEAIAPQPELYLAGHTHGGQVALPLYGALVTFSRFDKKYEAGRYQVEGTTLFVNRGIGFEPGLPRVRFFARPELTLIDVVGTAPR